MKYKIYFMATVFITLVSCTSNEIFIADCNQTIITDTTAINDQKKKMSVWTPTKKETDQALKKVYMYLKNPESKDPFSQGRKQQFDEIIKNKNTYCVQFIGIIRNNKKIIYCNFFPSDNEDHKKIWKSTRVLVFDGGSRYWNIEYIVDDDICDNLWINGMA